MGLQLQQKPTTSLHPWLIPGISLGLGISGLIVGAIFFIQYLNFNIKGVVNNYAVVQAISYNRVELDNAKEFAPEDKILLIQMQADTSVQTELNAIDNYELAAPGNYEFAVVQQVEGNTLYLTRPPCRAYNPAYKVQAVRVATYESIRIADTLRPQPWDGNTGGILVLEASKEILLKAPIDVRACGFRIGEKVLQGIKTRVSSPSLSYTGYPLLYLREDNNRVSSNDSESDLQSAGIVILKTPMLTIEQNSSILASGTLPSSKAEESLKVGGAGGTILLDIDHIQHPEQLSLDVHGGLRPTASKESPSYSPSGIINTHLPLPNTVNQILFNTSEDKVLKNKVFHTASFSSHSVKANNGLRLNSFVFPSSSESPNLDLNVYAQESHVTTYYRPKNPPKQLVDPEQIKVQDIDNRGLTRAMVRITNPMDGNAEQLILNVDSVELAQMGLSYTFSKNKHALVIIGPSLFPSYTELLGRIQYINRLASPTLRPREIEIQVDDGGSLSNIAKVKLEIRTEDPMVKWRFFKVETQNKFATLYWQTSDELSTYHYIVERSSNGFSYAPIAEIPSEGTKTEISNYRYIDSELKSLKGQTFFYRLKQTAPGGKFDYSQPITYKRPASSLDFAIFYQNKLARNKAFLQIQTPRTGKAEVDIYTPAGKTMYKAEHVLSPGIKKIELDISKWEKGTYITRVSFHHHMETTELIIN